MQYFVMSIKKTLVYFSGMEYHPTVANGKENFEEDKHCTSVCDNITNDDDESEDLVEPNQRISPDELCVLDDPDEQYIDEQGDRIAEEDADLHQNDSPMDSWPNLPPEAEGAVKVSTSLVNREAPLGCTDNLIPDPDTINTLSDVTLDDTGVGEEQAMVPTVATIVDNAKPTSVAMVSESISVPIGSPHPISYEFIKEKFASQVSGFNR